MGLLPGSETVKPSKVSAKIRRPGRRGKGCSGFSDIEDPGSPFPAEAITQPTEHNEHSSLRLASKRSRQDRVTFHRCSMPGGPVEGWPWQNAHTETNPSANEASEALLFTSRDPRKRSFRPQAQVDGQLRACTCSFESWHVLAHFSKVLGCPLDRLRSGPKASKLQHCDQQGDAGRCQIGVRAGSFQCGGDAIDSPREVS